jgi:lipopolysaccharide transport system permease protein
MITYISELAQSRDLLTAWTTRIIRGRYQQSALGWLWAVIQPAASVAMFTLIFTRFLRVDTGDTPYVIFSYAAIVPWTLLSASLTDMSVSVVQNMDLVSKIYFPREALPISAMLGRMIDFFVAVILLVGLMVYFHMPFFPVGWLYLPLILAIQVLLILGLGLIFSALNVFFRDVQPLLALGIQLWFYASPIIYPVSMVPPNLRSYYYLNPMAGILESYRTVLFHHSAPKEYLLLSAGISIVIFIIGYWLFKHLEFQFADIV